MYFDTASAVSFRQQHSDSGCIKTELLSPLDKDLGPEAFLSHSSLALHMARFPEAERRRLHKMICMSFFSCAQSFSALDTLLRNLPHGRFARAG